MADITIEFFKIIMHLMCLTANGKHLQTYKSRILARYKNNPVLYMIRFLFFSEVTIVMKGHNANLFAEISRSWILKRCNGLNL